MTATLPQQQPPQHGQFVPFVPQQWTQQQQQPPPPQLVQSNPGGVTPMYPLASAPGQPMLYAPSNGAANGAAFHEAPWQSAVPPQAFPGAVTYIVAPTPQPANHHPQQQQAIFIPSQQAVAVTPQAPAMAHSNALPPAPHRHHIDRGGRGPTPQAPAMAHSNALPPAPHRHHIDRGGRGPALTSPGGMARPRTMPAPPQIGPGERPERYKTAICRHAAKGRCLRGVACRFAHGDADLRTEEQNKAAGLTTFDAVDAAIAAAEASERKSTAAAVMNTITTHNHNIHHPTSNNAAMPAATAVEVKHTADAENYQHYVAIQAPPAMATSAPRSTPSATSSTGSSTPVHATGTSGTSVDVSIMNTFTPTPPFGAIAAFP
eukprot:CAMPEP_0174879268 /NCGR_PEP_ID=MMETSP1114-20130205/83175_1 /TAXON_ID=312471 /ORGANISM="Neobodo designis, Strain CCAP 1951/1" /LENGTH=374 /DNA_ID=CAMNT_0016114661 /DNA_START=153 /DNA_END=1277 /DNA_ORIENTATION=-